MTIHQLIDSHAVEHSELEDSILGNVAQRNWTRQQLREKLSNLYLMGFRHGVSARKHVEDTHEKS